MRRVVAVNASSYTVVPLPERIDTSNAGEVREHLLALLNSDWSGTGPIIADLTGNCERYDIAVGEGRRA